MSAPRFSVLVPVYDEGPSVARTVDQVRRQSVRDYELVVIEDSPTPETEMTVERLHEEGLVRRIRHSSNLGLAAARNSGVASALGEVVVFLDADVSVSPDFLARLTSTYDGGADAVAVESRVADLTGAVGRYQQAIHERAYPRMEGVGFSQAFSCRRDIAMTIGFEEQIPGCGADDGAFYSRMRAAGYSCIKRPDIVVSHRLPTSVRGLRRQASKRGRAIPHADQAVHGRTTGTMVGRRLLGAARAFGEVVLVVPTLLSAVALARSSPRGMRDLPAFWLLHQVFLIGLGSGELAETIAIVTGGIVR